jgi:hypothetical protein
MNISELAIAGFVCGFCFVLMLAKMSLGYHLVNDALKEL